MRLRYAALLPLLASCGMPAVQRATDTTQGQPRTVVAPKTTIIVGDSISYAAHDALLAAVPNSIVDAWPGRGPDADPLGGHSMRYILTSRIPQVPVGGTLVIQDDAGQDQPTTPEYVQWVTDTLPDDRCLVWVSPSNGTANNLDASTAAVLEGITAQPCHHFVDWKAAVAADPSLVFDGLHPSEGGEAFLADMVAGATR